MASATATIQVNSTYLSASRYLGMLRQEKNKFTRPHFKKQSEALEPSEVAAGVVIGENFERRKGKEIGEKIKEIKAQYKGWDKVNEPKLSKKDKKNLQKENDATSKYIEEIKKKAKEAEELRVRRIAAVTVIQKHVRSFLAKKKVAERRIQRNAAKKIKGFLWRLVIRKRIIKRGLHKLRLHFNASIITRFMRYCCSRLRHEQSAVRREQKVRGLCNGIKARMILHLPKMVEVKQQILGLSEQLKQGNLNFKDRSAIVDDIKYQKALYLNLFEKFWFKKISIAEELQREKDKILKKKNPSLATPLLEPRMSQRKNHSILEAPKSSTSSRKQSIDQGITESRFSFPAPAPAGSDDRPIKPMTNADAAYSMEAEFKGASPRLTAKSKSKDPKKAQQPHETHEVSDKVKKQRELMEKRRKYDPRKALQATNENKEEHKEEPVEKPKSVFKNKKKPELENIAENLSEDKSGILGMDEFGNPEDPSKPKKEFLKRKTKKVEFHKLDWSNVPRKIDCYFVNDGTEKEKKADKIIKPAPRKESLNKTATSQQGKDINMIKLKAEETKKKEASAKKAQKKKVEKDLLIQIEQTLENNYLPKLEEVFNEEIAVEEGSQIPILKNQSRFILEIEERDMKEVLEELENEYEFFVNM